MNRLEAHVHEDRLALLDRYEAFAPLFGGGHRERRLTHLAWVLHDVTHVDAEGPWPAFSHEGPCYPCPGARGLDSGGAHTQETRDGGRDEGRHIPAQRRDLTHQ
ncbi:hypothetical protein GCM10009777_28180 [Microbacterium pumilum]|uniref:Uncharacterized protein n=1 Tax=Microbacterium pumilum TaxID=344165 RepID=A0ABP5E5P4_9MICO